ncbi:MAG: LysR family transcriptional regulator [Planctomycetota bacterium]
MEIEQLRYFLQVAESKSITRAAELLCVSQSALSRSVQRLEADFGVPLLVRKTRRVELSDAGVKLKSRIEQILAILDDTRAELCDDGSSGRIRVGSIPTIAPYFLPAFLKRFSQSFPGALVEVYEETTKNLLHQCSQGEVDFAILALPIENRHLETNALFDEELLLALPSDHPLAERKKVRLKEIEREPFVMLDEQHCLSDSILSFCSSRSFQPVSVGRTNQLSMVQELVSLSHGISLVPQMAVDKDRAKTRIYRSIAGKTPKRTIGVVWDPYRFQSRLSKSFIDLLHQYCDNP